MAKRISVSIRSLRHYDKIELLIPSYVDDKGYRYYSESDVDRGNKITLLQILGFSFKEIAAIIDENTLQEELQLQSQMITGKIGHLRKIQKSITTVIEQVEANKPTETILAEVQKILQDENDRFHESTGADQNGDEVDHDYILTLLRKFIEPGYDYDTDFEELMEAIPQLSQDRFLDEFFVMLRLSKNNSFRLNELDQIEKNIRKMKKGD